MIKGLLIPLLALPVLLPVVAHADDAPANVTAAATITTEAWWTSNPVCSGGIACGTLGATPVDPYPSGTLHVAENPGAEFARSYLTLGTVAPVGATLVDAVLTLPLDTSTSDGNQAPDTSHVWVCTTTDPVTAGEAQVGTPPAADCTTHVELTYVAGTVPTLTGDLTPMLAQLVKPRVSLALVPSGSSAQTDAWHVVFSAHSAMSPATPPAALAITYTPAVLTSSTDSPAPAAASPPAASRHSATAPSSAAEVVVPPPVVSLPVTREPVLPGATTDTEAAPQPQVAPAAPADQGAQGATQPVGVSPRTVGFAYPGILLMPLVIGVLLLALGRQLTGSMRARPRAH